MLFNLIFRLQHEIDDLRAQISAGHERHTRSAEPPLTPHLEVGTDHAVPVADTTSIVRYGEHKGLDFSKLVDSTPLQAGTPAGDDTTMAATLEETERETIKRALERNMGRRRNAAAELNISERTLYRKIKEYNLE